MFPPRSCDDPRCGELGADNVALSLLVVPHGHPEGEGSGGEEKERRREQKRHLLSWIVKSHMWTFPPKSPVTTLWPWKAMHLEWFGLLGYVRKCHNSQSCQAP